MNFRSKTKTKRAISMAPMIDVVFLLLLFFMVTTTFDRETQVKIKLPEAAGSEAEQQQESVELIINADGIYFLKGADGMPHELINQQAETLKQELTKLAAHSSELPFIISADGKTPHQSVMTALDIAGQVGFTHITFEAQQPAAEQ